jgi:hypothetical protein
VSIVKEGQVVSLEESSVVARLAPARPDRDDNYRYRLEQGWQGKGVICLGRVCSGAFRQGPRSAALSSNAERGSQLHLPLLHQLDSNGALIWLRAMATSSLLLDHG